jgi:hypothetical protein
MKPFTVTASIVFAFIAVAQLARFILAWPVVVNGVSIPVWVSAGVAVFAALLAVMVWREAQPPKPAHDMGRLP